MKHFVLLASVLALAVGLTFAAPSEAEAGARAN